MTAPHPLADFDPLKQQDRDQALSALEAQAHATLHLLILEGSWHDDGSFVIEADAPSALDALARYVNARVDYSNLWGD